VEGKTGLSPFGDLVRLTTDEAYNEKAVEFFDEFAQLNPVA
jgi:hypothetical protein